MSALAQQRSKRSWLALPEITTLLHGLGGFALLLLAWSLWTATAHSVDVTIDGLREEVHTHRHTVGALLLDLGVPIQPQDRVTPTLETRVTNQLVLTVARARPFRILADGREVQTTSWGRSAKEVLADAGITLEPYDRVQIAGQHLATTAALPAPVVAMAAPTYDRGYAWERLSQEPVQIRVQRAIPVTVDEGGLPYTVRTTAETVGEALRQAEITLYLGDLVQPSLGSQVTAGLRIFIQRSTPVILKVDGQMVKTRTQAKTVAAALGELKIGVAGLDRVQPALDTRLYDQIEIGVTRVQEDIAVTEEIIPFETVFEPDPNLAIDTQQEVTPGAPGINRQRFHVRYEDHVETARDLQDSWVAQEATQRVIAYGQRIDPQTATMPDGAQITYWRKIRVYASSYSASTAGVSTSSPTYGRTYTGELMRTGIVAVDPRVIPLRAKLYVPGYGYGDALDTGSAIIGKHIDLGFDDDELEYWTRWVDVYLLWPPPPAYQITWVLPNYPKE